MNKTQTPAAFWDRVARRYAKMSMRNPDAYEKTLDLLREHLQKDGRVLELGCGTGSTALSLAPSVAHYVASDYSDEMIAIAAEKQMADAVHNVTFCVAQSGDGSLPDGPFDAVLAFNVLHLLADRRIAFNEVMYRLRPGGLFISKTPCLGGGYRMLQPLVAALRLFGKAPRLDFLTPAVLEREITNAGFKIIARGDYPKRPPSRFIVASKPAQVGSP